MSDLTAEDIAYARAVFDGLVKEFVRFRGPMPPTVSRARSILDRALTCWISLERHDIGPDGEESVSENIGSHDVAKMLGVTRRTVQRNAESLGGKLISGSWVFDPNNVGVDDVAS